MDLYLVLGVRREATLAELRRAYRRLARRYHPDVNPGDREAADFFRRISVAYETLIDPDRRQRYDVAGDAWVDVVESRVEFQGFDFSVTVDEPRASTFGELFADVLRERAGAGGLPAPAPGADLEATLRLTFDEAVSGGRHTLTVTRLEPCAPCQGLGRVPVPESRCPECRGTGATQGVRGHMVFSRTCVTCGGGGVQRFRTCEACAGEAVGVHTGPVAVEVPAGIVDGASVVVPGEGHAGRRGGPRGALRLSVEVQAHPWFRRVGDDLWIDVPVTVHEAAFGAVIDLPTLSGRARLRLPAGTTSGETFRLRGRGTVGTHARGDLVACIQITLPRALDERSRALLREFAARNPVDVRERWTAARQVTGAAPPRERVNEH